MISSWENEHNLLHSFVNMLALVEIKAFCKFEVNLYEEVAS